MDANEVVDLMFRLRGEAYSLWGLVLGVNTALIGWFAAKDLSFSRRQARYAAGCYLAFTTLMLLAFLKTYIELNGAVADLDFALASLGAGAVSEEGLLAYFRSKDYMPHFYFALTLNAVCAAFVLATLRARCTARDRPAAGQ